MMKGKEPELLLSNAFTDGRGRRGLEEALEKALRWQSSVDDELVEVNDH